MMNEARAIRAIGARIPRLEAREKLTGAARYSEDLHLPGMLHGALLLSPHAHARILGYEVTAARALAGVKAVLTGPDLALHRLGPMIHDETVLARDRVRYVGEPVAAVAAVDEETARAALRLIEVHYEELPAVLSIDAALAPDAPLLHEGFADYAKVVEAPFSGNALSIQEIRAGDADAALARADIVVEGVFETPAQAHAYLEPCAALAEVDARGKVTVWSSNQSVHRVQLDLCEGLGLGMAKIRAVAPAIGGAFGGKTEYAVQPISAALAMATGRPVRTVLSREDDFAMMRTRHAARIHMRTGASRDGILVARTAEILLDGGAYADVSPAVLGLALLMARGPYRIEHVNLRGRAVYTNKQRAAGFRGFGNPQVTFAGESQIDEIAERLGRDPIDLRLANALEDGDRWIGGQVMPVVGFKACLEKARDASDWASRRTRAGRRGVGVAGVVHLCGMMSCAATVRLAEDGSVTVNTGAVDLGQGSDTALAQICAGALEIDVDQVNFVGADTDASPYNWATGGSRVTYMVGRALSDASGQVREQILRHAAEMMECAEVDLELRPGGHVGLRGVPERTLSFGQVSARAIYRSGGPIMASNALLFDGEGFDPKRAVMSGFPFGKLGVYVFGAQVVEVELDDATGQVAVTGAWLAHDVGRAINPTAVEGQIQGGFVQGLGYALIEEMVWDGERLANPSFMDYKLPGLKDVPAEIVPIIVEAPEPTGPAGAKGVGEPGIVGVAPAIANAIAHASGARLRRLPMTPEAVLAALAARSVRG